MQVKGHLEDAKEQEKGTEGLQKGPEGNFTREFPMSHSMLPGQGHFLSCMRNVPC